MKKAILLLIPFLLISVVQAYESCNSLGGFFCTSEEFCSGDVSLAYDSGNILKKCCIGTCEKTEALNCEGLSDADIEGSIQCSIQTSKEKISNYKIASVPLFIKLLNPTIPAKPYPKLWDFWFNFALSMGAFVFIFTVIGYLKLFADETSSPEIIDIFKKRSIFLFLGALILLALPYISAFLFTSLDMALTIISRLFAPEGSVLALASSLLQNPGNSILYLLRDIMYFLFILVLLLRYFLIYILLVFSPIMVLMYLFYVTEPVGAKWLRTLLTNIFIPVVWLLTLALLIPISAEIVKTSPILLPILLAAVIYFNIFLYRKITGIDFSFRALLRESISLWRAIK